MHELDSYHHKLKKPILKYFVALLLTFCNLLCFEISFGQETYDGTNTPRQWYYNNLESGTLGTGSPGTYFSACSSTQSGTGIKLVSGSLLNSSKSLSTSGGTIGTISWNFLSNSTAPSTLALTAQPWEWEFDYQNTTGASTVDPDAATNDIVGQDSWRYWLIVTDNGTYKTGIYVTQVSGNLECREKFDNTNRFRVLFDVAMANNTHTYQVRVERSIDGLFMAYVLDRNTSTTTSTPNPINGNYENTYTLSYLEANSAAANRFQWDNFNFYQVRLDYLPITGNGVSNPIYPGMGTAIVYGMDVSVRGDIVMGRILINFSTDVSKLFGSNPTGSLYSIPTLPLTTTGATLLSDGNFKIQSTGTSQLDLSSKNLHYYSSGYTDGTTAHGAYFFLTAPVLSSFATGYPTSVSYSVSNTNNDTFSSFFRGASPYSANSSNSASTPSPIGDLWEWTGLAGATWTTQSAWKRDNTITGSAIGPSANTDIVRIGVSQYSSSTIQPQLPANKTVGALEIGPYGSNSSTVTPVILDLAGHTLTVSNGLTIDANATLKLENTSSTVANVATAGTSTMASTAAIAWPTTTGNGAILTNNGTFTLSSDASGSASIGALTATSKLAGTYILQRYLTGGTAKSRGYRLLSSPVSVSAGSLIIPNLNYINSTGYTSGSGSGFNAPAASVNPALYFFREDISTNNTNFTSGNYRGVSNINNGSTFAIDGGPTSTNLPAGNGFMYFFRGGKTTTYPFVAGSTAQTATLSSSGYLNQGDVIVRDWFSPVTTPTTTYLSYTTTTASIKNSSIIGYNLVGNPYASSINWDHVYSTNSAANPKLNGTIYIYNPALQAYTTYLQGSGGVGTNPGTNPPSTITFVQQANIIASGQGFFVKVTGANQTLTFHESDKIATQVSASNLSLATSAADAAAALKYLRVELFKDSTDHEDALVFFKPTAKPVFVFNEDAEYLKGNSIVNLSTRSSDNIALAINQMNFPASSQVIPLNVNMTAAGNYQIKLSEAKNIPAAYDVWLMDAYKKDSLDLKNNPVYTFEANVDTNTYGNHRFSVVIRQNAALTVHLLSFDAVKSTNDVKLNWKVENEANYTGYVVERSTDGGKTFKVIDSLTSAGLGTYNDLDPSPILGSNYYRLKQTDVAGAVSYSNVVKIMYANVLNTVLTNSNISVYPNPAQSTLNLTVTGSNNNDLVAATYKISIINSTGTLVKTATSTSGNWQAQIDNLTPGTYFVQVINTKNNTLTGKSTFVKL